MRRLGPDAAECLVFTFKEGLLSTVAHDLKLRVTRFEIDVDEEARTVEGRFDAGSLRVVCAMRDGKEAAGALRADQKREIEESCRRHVLDAARHPEIRYVSTSVAGAGGDLRVQGQLALHGRRKTIAVRLREEGARWVATARIHQPDFGIRPYTALLGALRVKPDVEVRVVVAA